METPKPKRWKRWTIAGTLFFMFCAAGFFTGFRYGLTKAVDRQVAMRLAERQQLVYVISYRIPVVPTNPSNGPIADIVAGVRKAVGRKQWSEAGGPCSLGSMNTGGTQNSGMIVVSAPSEVHQQVAAFLQGWQSAHTSLKANQE